MFHKKLSTFRLFGVPLGVWFLIIVARAAILGFMAVGLRILPAAELPGSWMVEKNLPFRLHLANFDGAWYIRIAALGYEKLHSGDYDLAEAKKALIVMDERGYLEGKAGFGYRHFPFFPYMIRAAHKVFRDWTLSGLAVCNFFSFIYILFIFRLTEVEFGEKAAWWASAFVTLAPNGHYLVAIYSEGIMLAGIAGSLYYARQSRWFLALLWGVLGAAIRFEGGLVAVGLFFILAGQVGGWRRAVADKRLFIALAVFLAFALPFLEFWRVTGHPLAAYVAQSEIQKVPAQWPWTSLMQDLKYMNPVTLYVDIPFILMGVVLTLIAVRRLSRPIGIQALAYMVGRLIQPHIGMLRFTMVLFPIQMYFGYMAKNRAAVGIILLLISTALLAFFCFMFVNGYWIA